MSRTLLAHFNWCARPSDQRAQEKDIKTPCFWLRSRMSRLIKYTIREPHKKSGGEIAKSTDSLYPIKAYSLITRSASVHHTRTEFCSNICTALFISGEDTASNAGPADCGFSVKWGTDALCASIRSTGEWFINTPKAMSPYLPLFTHSCRFRRLSQPEQPLASSLGGIACHGLVSSSLYTYSPPVFPLFLSNYIPIPHHLEHSASPENTNSWYLPTWFCRAHKSPLSCIDPLCRS